MQLKACRRWERGKKKKKKRLACVRGSQKACVCGTDGKTFQEILCNGERRKVIIAF